MAEELDRASELAVARGAPEIAAELAERAAELTPAENPRGAGARTLNAAALYLHGGASAKASRMLLAVLDGEDGALSAHALRLLAHVRFRDESFAEALALLHEVLASPAGTRLSARRWSSSSP